MPVLRIRRVVTGVLMLEVPGVDSVKNADALAQRLRLIFINEMNVNVFRAFKKFFKRNPTTPTRRSIWQSRLTMLVVANCSR